GSVSDIDAFITAGGLTFKAPLNSNADVTLGVAIDDLGNSPGPAKQASTSVTMHVAPVNDAPDLTLNVTTVAATEQTPVTLAPTLTLSDVDSSTLASATVRITGNYAPGEDVLSFVDTATIHGSFDPGTGTLTLTAISGTPPISDFQAALRAVTYKDTSDAPSTLQRTVTFTVKDSDGGSDTTIKTAQIDVSPVNDAPVNHVPAAQSVVQNQDLLFDGVSGHPVITVSDADAGTGSLTVTLTVGTNSTLTLGSTAGLIVDPGHQNGTRSVQVTGTLADINTALATLKYSSTAIGPDTLTITTDDNGNTGSGAGTDTKSVNIAVLSPTVPDLDANNSTATGDDYAALVTAINPVSVAIVDTDVTITDVAHLGVSSATIVLTNAVTGQDSLVVQGDTANTSGVLHINGREINWTVNDTSAIDGKITVSLDTAIGDTSAADYRLALQLITFNNTAAVPNQADRLITVSVASNSSASNTATSTVYFRTLDLDTAPTATGTGHADTFVEGGPAVAIASNAAVTDSTPIRSATVTITNYQASEDALNFVPDTNTMGDIHLTSNIGGVLTLTSAGASAAEWQFALDAVTYANSSNAPDTTTRDITVVLNDGTFSTNTAHAAIAIQAVNDAPAVATANATETVAEDQTLIFSNAAGNPITVSDIDANGGDETVTLTVASGALTLGSTPGTLTSLSGNGTATVTLTGKLADINTALDGLSYHGSLDFNGTDTLGISLNDNGNTGTGGSLTRSGSVTITVDPVNDPVTIATTTATAAEDTAVTLTGLSISDVDALFSSGAGGQYSVTLTAHHGVLNDGVQSGASLTLTDTLANLNATLAHISYQGNLNFNGTDVIDLTVTDTVGGIVATGAPGSGTIGTGTDTVTVTAVNDQVAISTGTSTTIDEYTSVLQSGIVNSDVDAALAPNGLYSVTLTADHGTLTDGVHTATTLT
ncbi:MAG: Fibronectin type domain protein, partial [Tardiphaga sp.]|nr:Fibronectin type domain protein [Tardiphaga sp.]